MSISWYSVHVSIQSNFLNYYFSVNNATNLITSFYNYNNSGVNILAPNILPFPFNLDEFPANNLFFKSTLSFNNGGVNFIDTSLKIILNNNSPYFKFCNTGINKMWMYTSNGTNDISTFLDTTFITITPILKPPPTNCTHMASDIIRKQREQAIYNPCKTPISTDKQYNFPSTTNASDIIIAKKNKIIYCYCGWIGTPVYKI
jgi:hypothetical protein